MNYKDILVFLDDGKSNPVRIQAAFYMAKAHGAKLTGVSLEAIKPEHLKVQDEEAYALIAKQFAHQLAEEFIEAGKKEGLTVNTIVIPGKLAEGARKVLAIEKDSPDPQCRLIGTLDSEGSSRVLLPAALSPWISGAQVTVLFHEPGSPWWMARFLTPPELLP